MSRFLTGVVAASVLMFTTHSELLKEPGGVYKFVVLVIMGGLMFQIFWATTAGRAEHPSKTPKIDENKEPAESVTPSTENGGACSEPITEHDSEPQKSEEEKGPGSSSFPEK